MRKSIVIILFLFLVTIPAYSNDTNTSAVKSTKPWWITSSLETTPLPQRLLFHVEGTLSFEARSGNMEGDAHRGNIMVAIRKQRFTNYIFARKVYSDFTLKFSNMEEVIDQHDLQNILEFDVTRLLYIDLTLYNGKDSRVLLDNRNAYFGSIGLHVALREGIESKISFGLGNKKDEYSPIIPYDDVTETAFFILQMANLNLKHGLSLHENLKVISDINDSENYEIDLMAQARYQITRYISISYIYDIKNKNVVWPGIQKTDSNHNLGLTVQFSN